MALRRDDGFAGRGDAVYAALLEAHRGLGDEESAALNARLVLILANHVGNPAILAEAIVAARASLAPFRPGESLSGGATSAAS